MRNALLVAAAFTLARLPMAFLLELAPDEAYYWVWSRRLELSYFDHPPMVAWLIAASTSLFGHAEWAVRLPALLAGLVIPVALARAAWELSPPGRKETAAVATALLASVMPLLHAGSVIVTPDSPAAAFWAVALAALAVARNGHARAWYVAGAALGLALLSKYPAVLLGVSMVVALPFDARLRRAMRTPHPWLAAALALVIFLPVLVWNARHEFASFAFQLGHGTAAGRGGLGTFVEFLGAQVGILTPTLAAILGIHLARGGQADDGDGDRFLSATILPTFALFALASLKSRPEANWPAFAYLGAAVVGGLAMARARSGKPGGDGLGSPSRIEERGGAERRVWSPTEGRRADRGRIDRWHAGLYRATVVLGASASLLVSIHALHPLVELPKDRLRSEFHGWRARGQAARQAAGDGGWIFGDSYRVAAEMAYYGGTSERIGVARRPGERMSMFDFWGDALPPRSELLGQDVVYVSNRKREVAPEWALAFEAVTVLPSPSGATGTFAHLENCRTLPGRDETEPLNAHRIEEGP